MGLRHSGRLVQGEQMNIDARLHHTPPQYCHSAGRQPARSMIRTCGSCSNHRARHSLHRDAVPAHRHPARPLLPSTGKWYQAAPSQYEPARCCDCGCAACGSRPAPARCRPRLAARDRAVCCVRSRWAHATVRSPPTTTGSVWPLRRIRPGGYGKACRPVQHNRLPIGGQHRIALIGRCARDRAHEHRLAGARSAPLRRQPFSTPINRVPGM